MHGQPGSLIFEFSVIYEINMSDIYLLPLHGNKIGRPVGICFKSV